LENNLKAAVIGCGGAGQVNHIPWYSQNKDVELVGLVDTNIDLVKKIHNGKNISSLTQKRC